MHLRLFACFVGTVISDDKGLTLEKAGKEVLGTATKVVITKGSTLIVTDGSTKPAVEKRVSQIQRLVEVCLLNLSRNIVWAFSYSLLFYIPY